ncbi:FadD3 family acyl-CoA ligase [Prauserella muralis]|uniref:Fatty acid--CoA ligase n=1 Tax=Prauserella muralis TaxID=588067 RepID=A0A2V4AMI1_9PSEU|nr:FadD3 family acyl-CoA ligase [Prauserella muralis]PXY20819.1 fatty acid--CoA ligase [Prauserella muralis]TWE29848.1 acyl-CoA synthetase (AMP-forming)/AMP-acid ligase II [Prauserella muralis]
MAAEQLPGSIPEAVRRAAERFGSREAVVDGDVRLTYADLLERVRTVARFLVAEGVRPGDRVAVNSPNTHHWLAAALGAQYAGASLVPVNTRFTGPETVDLLRRSGARALVVAGDFLGADRLAAIREAAGPDGLPALRTIVRVPLPGPLEPAEGVHDWPDLDRVAARVPLAEVEARADAVGADDVSDILYTSGTTGRSKGVLSAHRQALAVAAAWAGCGEVAAEDRYLVVNPFFHSFGYKAGILVCLLTGATLLPQAVFDAARTLELIERERVSVLPGAPTIFQTLLHEPARRDRDTASLRLAVTGAATVPQVLVERLRSDLGFETVLTAYGLTEAVVATMCRPGDDAAVVSRTSGRAAAGFEVAIGADGEVLLRGPNVMLGYLDDPEATTKAIDADGWLHTGDVGVLDDAGNLSITDRLKDMYVCGGFNVYPAEVEQVLARLDGVRDVAVVGVPDERLGEVGKAFVVADGELTEDAVLGHCAPRLANYKRPRSVAFVPELPRNASGKVLKRLLGKEKV